MHVEYLYQLFCKHPWICTDTRKIIPNGIFFALKGERFDGNAFVAKALGSGASYAVIDDPRFKLNNQCILVENVLSTLQSLARHHREHLKIPFIGITGTNGKTTTKELIHAVLQEKYRAFATPGNLNNHIGVPLSLLAAPQDADIGIIEMGANHQHEISFLCNIAKPTHGLITNVGKGHLEGFGSYEGVKKAKSELYEYLHSHRGTAFINQDNKELINMSAKYKFFKTMFYGTMPGSLLTGKASSVTPFLTVEWHEPKSNVVHTAHSNLHGVYNLENILAAISIGYFFGLSPEAINEGIANYHPSNQRSQIVVTNKNTLICDYYNANPDAMRHALNGIATMEAQRKVIILGDMLELGTASNYEHGEIIRIINTIKADKILIGPEFYKHCNKIDASFYRTTQEACETLKKKPIDKAVVLLKGSRGMQLEMLREWL